MALLARCSLGLVLPPEGRKRGEDPGEKREEERREEGREEREEGEEDIQGRERENRFGWIELEDQIDSSPPRL